MKKILIALTLMLTLLTTCLVGCTPALGNSPEASDSSALKATAAAVFTLDVNPGVRIYVKEDNTVISVEATNEDGEDVIAELEPEGEDYEQVVEQIIDEMDEQGYLEGDESSVLVSVEKKAMDISERVNDRINKAFEKHGKRASVIEQDFDALDEEIGKTIGEMAKRYKISEGKAHLIEKIREEFPELSEEELASLKVNDLGMMLEDTSDDIKGHFKKVGKAVEGAYVGREQALEIAIESLENPNLTAQSITMHRVRVTRGEGKMLYEVEFVYDGMEYTVTVCAKTGEVLASESKEFEQLDAEKIIDDFCHKHNVDKEGIKDHVMNEIFDRDEKKDEKKDEKEEDNKPLTRRELLKGVIEALGISEDALKKTDVKLHRAKGGEVAAVIIELNNGDTYKIVVETFSATVLKAELNGAEFEIPASEAEAE